MKRDTKMVFAITGAAVVLYLISQAKKTSGSLGAVTPPMTKAEAVSILQKFQSTPHQIKMSEYNQVTQAQDVLRQDRRSILQRIAQGEHVSSTLSKMGYIQPTGGKLAHISQFWAGQVPPAVKPRTPVSFEVFDPSRNTYVTVMGATGFPQGYPAGVNS